MSTSNSGESIRWKTLASLAVALLLCLAGYGEASDRGVDPKAESKTGGVDFREVPFVRTLPHSYYDQALSSIRAMYPDAEIVAKRRVGYLNKKEHLLYSILCYRKTHDATHIRINGVVILGERAWTFDTKTSEAELPNRLIHVLESLARLPFDEPRSASDPSPENRMRR